MSQVTSAVKYECEESQPGLTCHLGEDAAAGRFSLRLMPNDDFYEWHCEWCDSKNRTLWFRFTEKQVKCAACQHTFNPADITVG